MNDSAPPPTDLDSRLGEPVLVDGRLCDVVAGTELGGRPALEVRERTSHWQRRVDPKRDRQDFVDQASIRTFVHRFYAKVADDPELGPVFDRRLHDRWDAHLDKMVRFWSTVLLAVPGYRGNPRASHVAVDDGRPEHFTRWLELFDQTLTEVYEDECAALVLQRAHRMARGLSNAMFGAPFDGGPVGPYPRPR